MPLTHALEGLRLAVLRGAGVPVIAGSILALSLWCAAAAPAAILVVRWALHEAKRSGAVSGYG